MTVIATFYNLCTGTEEGKEGMISISLLLFFSSGSNGKSTN